MNVINIPHIDQYIWNVEDCVMRIIFELSNNKSCTINIDDEGSDLAELGLYSILDNICGLFNFDKSVITIITRNQLETHPQYKIRILPPLYVDHGQKFASNFNGLPKDFSKKFGIFIGRSNWQRLLLASHLYKNHKDVTMMTFHYDSSSDYHKSHLSFDRLSHMIGLQSAKSLSSELLENLPMVNDEIESYPILSPAHFNIAKVYHKFFVEIVCETFSAGDSFYPTEKTWRPIICRTPFTVQGPVNFLSNLRKLGFKTFDKWWDESYDEDGGMVGIDTIIQNIESLSTVDVRKMYLEMQDTVEHNYQTFMNLKGQDFIKVYGK